MLLSRREVLGAVAVATVAPAAAALGRRTGPSSSISSRFDALFGRYSSPGSPGICFAGLEDGEVLFRHAYGCAEIEFGAPITPQTVFHVASISKQFTGFSIALLERAGKVDLDAPVRRYLPWMTELDAPLTVRHLVHHVGGLPDMNILFIMAGRDLRDVLRRQMVIDLVARQRSDFAPGSEYRYSNTGYFLLGEIVAAVSGMSLRQFVHRNILEPLGMDHTLFYDDLTEVIPARAQSYFPSQGGGLWHIPVAPAHPQSEQTRERAPWTRALMNFEYVGTTNLATTLDDLLKWAANFHHPKVGDEALLRHMTEPGKRSDGTPVHYAYGLTRARLAGHELIMHTGSDAGFCAIVVHQPERRRSLVMAANCGADTRPTAEAILDVWLNGGSGHYVPATPVQTKTVPTDIEGAYLEPFGRVVRLVSTPAGLLWREAGSADSLVLFRVDGSFDLGGTRRWIYRPVREAGRIVAIEEFETDEFLPRSAIWKRVELVTPSPAELAEFVGDYRSDDLDVTYHVTMQEGGLVARTLGSVEPKKLVPGPADQFACDAFALGTFVFLRDAARRVTGLRMTSYYVRNIPLRRIIQ